LAATDAGKAVLRTITAESATFVLSNIFVSLRDLTRNWLAVIMKSSRLLAAILVAAPTPGLARQAVPQLSTATELLHFDVFLHRIILHQHANIGIITSTEQSFLFDD
jgi:hypothetical protein